MVKDPISLRVEHMLEREAVRSFFTREAVLLDSWSLQEWADLFTDDGSYLIEPTGDDIDGERDPAKNFYLVIDDRAKLQQRVERLGKVTAHAEFPHSMTRHLFTNVRILGSSPEGLTAAVDFLTVRNRRRANSQFVGTSSYELVRVGTEDFRIRLKTVSLAHENLFEQGKLPIIL
jgi:p-cumate 2,3-dioxygenase beta subunit